MAGPDGGSDIDWAPYHNRGEAACFLFRLVDRMLGPDVGVVWTAWDAAIVLRKPILDNLGFGHSAIFRWHPAGHGALPPPAVPNNPVPATNFFADFLANKDNEHKISFGFDVLAIVVATAIAVAATPVAAALAFLALIGAGVCALLDGAYLALRYFSGGSVESRSASATAWDNDPVIGNLSIVGLALTMPDFFINGAATVKNIPKALGELKGKPAKMAAEVAAEQAKAADLGAEAAQLSTVSEEAAALARNSQRASALSKAQLAAASEVLGARAQKIAQAAGEAYARGEALQATLHTRIMHEMAAESAKFAAEKGSLLVGSNTAIGYFVYDNWVSQHMLPPHAAVSYQFNANPGSFIMTVATSHQSRV
jgi:hypothetical protein